MRVKYSYLATFVVSFVLMLLSLDSRAERKIIVSHPLIWNVENIQRMKYQRGNEKLYNSIIETSDYYCSQSPVVVTEKNKTFAPNNHYYCSIGIYWWPDPKNTNGTYINKDGIVNPESKDFDSYRISEFSKRCKYLSIAFYLTRNRKYYKAFINQLKAWFLNETTYMYPNIEYAQVRPGYNNNKGRATGTIDLYSFNDILESIRLTNTIKKINRKTLAGLQKWFTLFSAWLEDSGFVTQLNITQNNVSLAFDVTLCNIYCFIGEYVKAQKIINCFYEKRLLSQIRDNGEQPAELVRTKAFSYSIYNLKHILDFFFLARNYNAGYYEQYGLLVDRAFEYLLTFIDRPEEFPYKQVSSWRACRYDLGIELMRRERLTKRKLDNSSTIITEGIPLDTLDCLIQ